MRDRRCWAESRQFPDLVALVLTLVCPWMQVYGWYIAHVEREIWNLHVMVLILVSFSVSTEMFCLHLNRSRTINASHPEHHYIHSCRFPPPGFNYLVTNYSATPISIFYSVALCTINSITLILSPLNVFGIQLLFRDPDH